MGPHPSLGLETSTLQGRHMHTGFRCCLRALLSTALHADTPSDSEPESEMNPLRCSCCRWIARSPTGLNKSGLLVGGVPEYQAANLRLCSVIRGLRGPFSQPAGMGFVGRGAEKQAQERV